MLKGVQLLVSLSSGAFPIAKFKDPLFMFHDLHALHSSNGSSFHPSGYLDT